MNSSWLKMLLIVSLGLNCMIAGAFMYRVIGGKPLFQFFDGPPPHAWPDQLISSLPPKNIAAHEQLRKKIALQRQKIADTKNSLMDLLAAPAPDRSRIEEQLGAINKLHAERELMIVEQMIEDIQSLPLEKRASFIEDIKQSMYCRRGDGPGMGRGPEGHGGWRRGKKDF